MKGEKEKSALVCRRLLSIDRGRLMSAEEREWGEECARVFVLVDDRPI